MEQLKILQQSYNEVQYLTNGIQLHRIAGP
jgi:hypothetical protein